MITITINAGSAGQARREMQALLGGPVPNAETRQALQEAESGTLPSQNFEELMDDLRDNAAKEESAAEPEQPRRGRGRPRKTPQVIEGEATVVSETAPPAAEPEQIDLEEVIAAKSEPEAPAPGADKEVVEQTGPSADAQPADPDKGGTHDDAKNVARAMYVRLGTLQQHELDEKLHNNLQKFGVQRIKDLPADKIGDFVRGIEAEVA